MTPFKHCAHKLTVPHPRTACISVLPHDLDFFLQRCLVDTQMIQQQFFEVTWVGNNLLPIMLSIGIAKSCFFNELGRFHEWKILYGAP